MSSRILRLSAIVALGLLAPARPTVAGVIVILSPNSFSSLGSFEGNYSYAVDTLAVTMTSAARTYTGVTSPDGSAVFTFDDITFDAGRFMTVTGPRPFAFLSKGSATIAGEINGTAGQADGSGVAIQVGALNAVSITGQVRSNGGVGTSGTNGSPGSGGGTGSDGGAGDPGEAGGSASGSTPGSGGQGASGATASGGRGGYGDDGINSGSGATGSTGGDGGNGGGGGGGGGGADGGDGTDGSTGGRGDDGTAGGNGGNGGEILIHGMPATAAGAVTQATAAPADRAATAA